VSLYLKGRYILNIQEKVGHGTIGFKANHDEKKRQYDYRHEAYAFHQEGG
jgi:hypothetical protein